MDDLFLIMPPNFRSSPLIWHAISTYISPLGVSLSISHALDKVIAAELLIFLCTDCSRGEHSKRGYHDVFISFCCSCEQRTFPES